MLKDFDITPEDPAELRAVNRLLADEVKALSLKAEQLRHQLAGQNRHRFGVRSESLDQLNLTFAEDEEIAGAAEEQAKPAPPSEEDKPARSHSRKPVPDHLDRHEEVLSPGEECTRCGGALKTPGEDVTEALEYGPGRFVVNRILRPRKACSCCEAIVQAPLPSRPIERGRSGPGLPAHVLVSKTAPKPGCMHNCRRSRASPPWPRPSATPRAGCRKRVPIPTTATRSRTTTLRNGP